MKPSIKSLVACAAIALTAVTAHAQTAPKILVVDLAKLFDNHWKTKEQQAKLQSDEAKAQDQLAAITKDGNALVEQFKELDEQSKNPTATADAKAKAQGEAQKKYDEIQQKRGEQQQFVTTTKNTLQQRFQNFKALMLEEITKSATEIAKKHGANLLLDKSGPTLVGVSNVLYFDPSYDITDEVMTELNKDAPPASATTTPSASAPATSTTPAADSPQITVPGISK
jgi:outer membrane protein